MYVLLTIVVTEATAILIVLSLNTSLKMSGCNVLDM